MNRELYSIFHFPGHAGSSVDHLSYFPAGDTCFLLYALRQDTHQIYRIAQSTDQLHWADLPLTFPESLQMSSCRIRGIPDGPSTGPDPDLVTLRLVILKEGSENDSPEKRLQWASIDPVSGAWDFHSIDGLPDGIEEPPAITWYEPGKKWITAIPTDGGISLFASKDLSHWQFLSRWAAPGNKQVDSWQSPELFSIPIGYKGARKWVLWARSLVGHPNGTTGIQYVFGTFDGTYFTEDPPEDTNLSTDLWLDYGNDFNIVTTWPYFVNRNQTRAYIGRSCTTQEPIGSASCQSGLVSLPRHLIAGKTAAGLRLFSQPFPDLAYLRQVTYTLDDIMLEDSLDITSRLGFPIIPMEILLEVEIPEGGQADVGIEFFNGEGEHLMSGFESTKNQFYTDLKQFSFRKMLSQPDQTRWVAPRVQTSRSVRMRWFIDRNSIELFADWGATTQTVHYSFRQPLDQVRLFSYQTPVTLSGAIFYQLDQ